MKCISRFLSLLICFELLLAPFSVSFIRSSNAAESCAPGYMLSPTGSGMCVLNTSMSTNALGAQDCASITDVQAKRDCYEKYSGQNLSGGLNPHSKDEDWKRMNMDGKASGGVAVLNSFVLAVPLFILTKSMIHRQRLDKKDRDQFKCNPYSLLMMYGGAGVLGLGEIISLINHRSKMKDLDENWKNLASTNSSQNQDDRNKAAFDAATKAWLFQRDNERQVEKTTNLKEGYYTASTALFAGGLLMAGVELLQIRAARVRMGKLQAELIAQTNLLKAAFTRLAVPATAAEAAQTAQTIANQIVDINKRYIDAAKTINRVTCHTGTKKSREASKQYNNALTDANKNLDDMDKNLSALKEQQEAQEKKNLAENKTNQTMVNSYNSQLTMLTTLMQVAPILLAYQSIIVKQQQEIRFLKASLESREMPLAGDNYNHPSTEPRPTDNVVDVWNNKFNEEINLLKDSKYRKNSFNVLAGADNVLEVAQALEEIESMNSNLYNLENYRQSPHLDILEDIKIDSSITKSLSSFLIQSAHAAGPYQDLDEYTNTQSTNTQASNSQAPQGNILSILSSVQGSIKFAKGTPISSDALKRIEDEMSGGFSRFIYSPWTRATINTMLGAWTGVMAIAMKRQSELAKTRAEELQNLHDQFLANQGILGCTPELRNDSSRPECYCYNANNTINTSRANHEACKGISSNTPSSVSYLTKPQQTKACVDQQYGLDPKCSCKNRKSSSGGNSCLNVSVSIGSGIMSPGTFKMLGASMAPANDILSGNATGADIGSGAGANAAAIRKVAEEILNKAQPGASAKIKQEADTLGKAVSSGLSGLQMSGPMNIASNSAPIARDPKKAAEELEKTLKEASSIPNFQAPLAVTPADDLLGDGLETNVDSTEAQLAEVMGKELDYGNNDINSQPSGNIFDLLSNRYQRSGLKRLFEDSAAPTDAAAKSGSNP